MNATKCNRTDIHEVNSIKNPEISICFRLKYFTKTRKNAIYLLHFFESYNTLKSYSPINMQVAINKNQNLLKSIQPSR